MTGARTMANWLILPALVAGVVSAGSASATDYPGESVRLVIGFPPGGGFDAFGRTVAAHLGDNLPGKPNIIIQNMPGAGSLVAANWLFNVAPQDGSVIGLIHGTVTLEPLFKNDKARFDVRRFNWLGSPSTEYGIAFTYKPSATQSLEDARRRETPVAGISAGAPADFMTVLQNEFLGTKYKLVTGYPGTRDIALAIERGEVEGMAGWFWSSLSAEKSDWLRDDKVNLLLQLSLEPHADLTKRGVPFIFDLVKNENDRRTIELGLSSLAVGRPFAAPPNTPKDRVAILRAGFDKTMKDPAFTAAAQKRGLPIDGAKTGAELELLLERVYSAPPAIVNKVIELQKRTR